MEEFLIDLKEAVSRDFDIHYYPTEAEFDRILSGDVVKDLSQYKPYLLWLILRKPKDVDEKRVRKELVRKIFELYGFDLQDKELRHTIIGYINKYAVNGVIEE